MIQLYLQYTIAGATTTIDFQAGGCHVLDPFRVQVADDPESTVAERFDVWLTGTQSQAETLNRSINRAFEHARRHPRDLESVWLYFALTETSDAWRARVVNGRAELTDQLLRQLGQNRLRLAVMIEREASWQGAEAQIPLTNDNGTDNTSGLTVFNCADGSGSSPTKRVNYVQIAADQVAGDRPAPVRLEITNSYNNAAGLSVVWVGHNVESEPASFSGLLEAEAATGGTNSADATCSGGNYSTFTLTNSGETDMFAWTIPAADVDKYKGYFRVLARFQAATVVTSVRFRTKLYSGVTPLADGPQVLPSSYYAYTMRDLGVIKLPPWLSGLSNQGALNLRLTGKRTEAVNKTVALDFLYLLPLDSYRQYELLGALPYQSRVVDDDLSGYLYTENSSGQARAGGIAAYGSPLHLIPGRVQRLVFFLHSGLANTAAITQTLSVKLYYRPRRLGL